MNEQRALQRAGAPGEEPRVGAFVEHVGQLLVSGERIEAWAIQRRFFALVRRRVLVVATTGRLLVFTRNLIAGYDMREVRWQDLSSARIRVGAFGAALTVGVLDGADLASAERASRTILVSGLRKVQAQEVYRLCTAHDQAWREKRRIRDLEEMRARAGGVQIGAGQPMGALPAAGGPEALTDRLTTARDMLARGIISDAEYQGIKAKIIASI
jgi:hypothetical protein